MGNWTAAQPSSEFKQDQKMICLLPLAPVTKVVHWGGTPPPLKPPPLLLLLTRDMSVHSVPLKLSLLLKFPDLLMGTLAHQSRRVPVGAPQTVPQCKVLAVVVVEEEVVVRVVGRAVDDVGQGGGDAVVAVVDGDGPDVDEDVQGQVEQLVEGEEEGVDVVREPLQEAVHWVKGVAGEGGGDLPQVVRFVEQLKDERMERLQRESRSTAHKPLPRN